MQTQYIPYGTVALICAAALSHFSANIRRYAPDTPANRYFRTAILASAVCALMEFFFCFHESGFITNLVYCYTTEICYSTASLVCGYFWFMCSETEQNAWTVRTKTRLVLFTLPFAIMALAVITTPIHHLSFYFTENGHYVRGILNMPLIVLTAVYIAKSGVCALVKSFRVEHYFQRSLYRTFFYYALAILIAQILQLALGSVLPFRIIGAVFVFFLVQERAIKENVYIDLVSDANNRTAMEKYLRKHFETADSRFAYAMIDMDDFKDINDRYGHSVGDRVIALISEAFKLAVTENLFFARYGGDEFVLIGETSFAGEIDRVVVAARENMQRLCRENGLDFCPEFSYGVAYKTPDVGSIPELINCADAAMYENKQKHKAEKA